MPSWNLLLFVPLVHENKQNSVGTTNNTWRWLLFVYVHLFANERRLQILSVQRDWNEKYGERSSIPSKFCSLMHLRSLQTNKTHSAGFVIFARVLCWFSLMWDANKTKSLWKKQSPSLFCLFLSSDETISFILFFHSFWMWKKQYAMKECNMQMLCSFL